MAVRAALRLLLSWIYGGRMKGNKAMAEGPTIQLS
jgi:hypothetical protein